MPWHRFGSGFDGGWIGRPFMWLHGLLLFLCVAGLLAWLIVALVRHGRRGRAAPVVSAAASAKAAESAPALPKAEDALEIVRLRYARGEITREEFLALRDDLAK